MPIMAWLMHLPAPALGQTGREGIDAVHVAPLRGADAVCRRAWEVEVVERAVLIELSGRVVVAEDRLFLIERDRR